jgi:hypothetical protein
MHAIQLCTFALPGARYGGDGGAVLRCVLQDVSLTQQWLLALARAGYQFPSLHSPGVPAAAAGAAQALAGAAAAPAKVLRASQRASRWAVFTTAAAPTAAIKRLAAAEALNGWRVVVVAEQALPAGWSWPNVTQLTLQQQEALCHAV